MSFFVNEITLTNDNHLFSSFCCTYVIKRCMKLLMTSIRLIKSLCRLTFGHQVTSCYNIGCIIWEEGFNYKRLCSVQYHDTPSSPFCSHKARPQRQGLYPPHTAFPHHEKKSNRGWPISLLEQSQGFFNWRMGLPALLGGNLGCRIV